MIGLLLGALLGASPIEVRPIDDELRGRLGLSPFYVKTVDARGLPIVASERVADAALREAYVVVTSMLQRHPEFLAELGRAKVRLAVMAPTELTTDIPEHSDLTPKAYWDRRARGLGATAVRPAVSCAEENLLGEPGDPYPTESICVHEFAHAVHELVLRTARPDFEPRLKKAFEAARAKGTWKKTYAMTNEAEYWAEAVQSWFDTNRHDDAEHGAIDTREEVRAADPLVAKLITDTLGDVPWRYRKPKQRPAAELALLGAFPDPLPSFAWPKELAAPAREGAAMIRDDAPPSRTPEKPSPETGFTLHNGTDAPIALDWIDFRGKLVRYATLAPGATHEQQTYVGHVWVLSKGPRRLGWFEGATEHLELVVPDGRGLVTEGSVPVRRSTPPGLSPKSTVEASISIENRGRRSLTLSWVSFTGELTRYATLRPGTTVTQPTWAGHVWVLLDGPERVGWFEAPAGRSTLVLR